jgi:hypothetical protein
VSAILDLVCCRCAAALFVFCCSLKKQVKEYGGATSSGRSGNSGLDEESQP